MKGTCYVLTCNCHSGDDSVSVYRCWDVAHETMIAEMEAEISNLQNLGHEVTSYENDASCGVYVPDAAIYYDWSIKETIIEDAGEDRHMKDCFAYDKLTGRCTCLTAQTCRREGCPFYKKAGQALAEARRSLGLKSGYDKNIFEVIRMIERNQGEKKEAIAECLEELEEEK